MQPLLSVIVPVYNVEKYLDECLGSIMRQLPGADMEVILIDDGSTDAGGTICDRYAKENPKIKVIHQTNRGLAAARNTGLAVASGQYVGFIDSDDYVADDWYAQISAALTADESIDILFFDYIKLNNNKRIVYRYDKILAAIPQRKFMYELSLNIKLQSMVWRMVYRRSLFDGVRFPVSAALEDYPIQPRLIMKAKRIQYLSQVLYFYRTRGDSLIGKMDLGKSFACCLLADERYEFLMEQGFVPSMTGRMIAAWVFCVRYHRSDASARAAYKEKYDLCRRAIRQNIAVLLKDRDSPVLVKIKFLLISLDLLRPAVYLHDRINFLRRMW